MDSWHAAWLSRVASKPAVSGVHSNASRWQGGVNKEVKVGREPEGAVAVDVFVAPAADLVKAWQRVLLLTHRIRL